MPKKNMFMIITAEASTRTRNEFVHVCSGSVIGKHGSPSLSAFLRARSVQKVSVAVNRRIKFWRNNEQDYLYLCWENQPFVSGEFTETGGCLFATWKDI